MAGIAIGLAAGCRVSLVLYGLAPGLLIIAYFWTSKVAIRSALVHVAVLSLPVVVSGLLQMGYNDARFGSPFDYGNGDLVAWIIPKDVLSLVFSTLGVV